MGTLKQDDDECAEQSCDAVILRARSYKQNLCFDPIVLSFSSFGNFRHPPRLNLRVQDIEIILQMNDAEAKPWNLGVVVGASVELPLHMLSKSAEDWQIDLNLEDRCCAESTSGLILGPCDLQIEAKGSKKRDLDNPDQCLSLALALSSCPNCIRINQYQLGLFSRLSHVFILWDALLRSLDLHSMQRSRMKELLELTGQEPLSCGRISISGVFPGLELVEESGLADGFVRPNRGIFHGQKWGFSPSEMRICQRVS
eukprot:s2608_g1.t1